MNKDRKWLIDGDILTDLIENQSIYSSIDGIKEREYRPAYLRFDEIFYNSSGWYFNQEKASDLIRKRDENPELMSSIYFSRLNHIMSQDGSNNSWEPLSDDIWEKTKNKIDMISDDGLYDWNAVFVDTNDLIYTTKNTKGNWNNKEKFKDKSANLDFTDVRENSKKKMSHFVEMNDVFSTQSAFRRSINFEDTKKPISMSEKPYSMDAKKIFEAFQHPSKDWIVYDRYQLQDKNVIFNSLSFETILKYLCFYVDWAYSNYLDFNCQEIDLPNIHFISQGFETKRRGGFVIYDEDQLREMESRFLEKILNINEDHRSIKRIQSLIKLNKIHFFNFTFKEFKENEKKYGLHGNAVITDYGWLQWDERRAVIFPSLEDRKYHFFTPLKCVLSLQTDEGEFLEQKLDLFKSKNDKAFLAHFFKVDQYFNYEIKVSKKAFEIILNLKNIAVLDDLMTFLKKELKIKEVSYKILEKNERRINYNVYTNDDKVNFATFFKPTAENKDKKRINWFRSIVHKKCK